MIRPQLPAAPQQHDSTAHPLDALWRPSAIGWALLAGEALATILALAPGVEGSRWKYFGHLSIAIQWILLFSLGGLYLARDALRSMRPQRIAYAALGILLASAWIITGGISFFFRDTWNMSDGDWIRTRWSMIGIVMTVGISGVVVFQTHWRAQRMASRMKQAELEALQARIRPHFLFNTLNTATALVHQRPEEAERLLLDLADLFRAALAGPREITLDEELSLARRYLEIESLRFGERLRVEWQLPREIPHVRVPALSIQPLVENAIRHGVERVAHGGRIEIALTTTAEHVVVRITNPLVLSDRTPPVSHQVGLNAAQARIEALTGGRGSVQTGRQGEHWVATVRLPRRPASTDRRRR